MNRCDHYSMSLMIRGLQTPRHYTACDMWMTTIKASNKTAQTHTADHVARRAFPVSHHVSGRIPCARNVTTPAKLMQITFVTSNKPAR
jgi:hypothetical protein